MAGAREIYLLDPRTLRPEVIAVTFAKTSRSPESFREIARDLTAERSAEFHERWVVGYGHASVAEHAVLHVALENVSRLAIECVESNRLASYTEKSTRYQIFAPDSFYVPRAVADSPHAALYLNTCRMLLQAYADALEPLKAVAQARYPRRADETDSRWDARIRSRFVDNARFLLPAAMLANVGMTVNARVLEHAIVKMLSHPLAEVREIGAEVKAVAQAEVPTLVKYADASPYLAGLGRALAEQVREVAGGVQPDRAGAVLVDCDAEAEERVLAGALYGAGAGDFARLLAAVRAWPAEQRASAVAELLGGLGPFDIPLRELEHVRYTFDVVLDQGAYFEAKRHRMMTQTPGPLTAGLGYVAPRAFLDAGLEARYREAQERAADAYHRIAADLPHEASYVVTNAFKRRVLMAMNLREAFHFCRLRSAENAHFSIRHIALEMIEAIRRVHPILASYMRCDDRPGAGELAEEYFADL